MNDRLVWLCVNCSYSHSTLALPLIHAACRDVPGWEWKRVEIISDEDSAENAVRIAESDCTLLCAQLYLFNREKTLDILKRVHALAPQIHIAVGGPECPPCDAEKILQENPFIGTVFCGEAENSFPGFLKNFEEFRNVRTVLPADGRAVYDDWEHSPFPVSDPFFRTGKPFVQIETSRGCPMGCAYCTSSGVLPRYRTIEQVRKELQLLHEKGVREIRVLDRTFNVPQSRGAELLKLFSTFPDMKFHLEIHPQFLGEELRECLRSARREQLHIEAGIQSLDPAVQQAIGRRSEVEKALEGVRFLSSQPMFETHTDLLAGLPAQSFASLKSDILKLIAANPAEIQLEVLKILPGTPVKQELDRYGIVYSPAPPYDVMRTNTMSAQEILQARKLSILLDLFFNHRALHDVLQCASEEQYDFFLTFAEHIFQTDKDLNTLRNLEKRFLYLQEFLPPRAKEELVFRWLCAGFSANKGPGTLAEAIETLPDALTFISGNPDAAYHKESHFCRLKRGGTVWYLCFNRAFCFNTPCALWCEK